MKKSNALVLLLSSLPLLCGCSPDSVSSSSSSSSENENAWNEKTQTLLKQYCGEILPYPAGLSGSLIIEEEYDEEADIKYLLIASEADKFSLGDYYKELEASSWTGIVGYNNEIKQTSSDGYPYYELVKTSPDGEIGYSISYTFFVSGDEESDKKYNLIQCFNDFDAAIDEAASWSEGEQAIFDEHICSIPPFLKFGSSKRLVEYNDDMVYCHDRLAKNLSKENAEILAKDGYVLDETLSKEKDAYVLKKSLDEGHSIIASLYYSSGNYASFAYESEAQYSKEWPASLSTSFKTKTGYDLPSFYSEDGYYWSEKKGVMTIYAYSEDASSYLAQANISLNELLVADETYNWYTDWKETFYIKPQLKYDESGASIFAISYAYLDEPYDTLMYGWPKEEIESYLKENDIEGECPDFSFVSLSASSTVRVKKVYYEDAYKEEYEKIAADPYAYLDDPSEESIKALASKIAKAKTGIKIKILETGERLYPDDPSSEKANKVYNHIDDACYKNAMAEVRGDDLNPYFSRCYENAAGSMAIGLSNYLNVSSITLTYGSGNAHSPKFAFETKSKSLSAGDIYNLDLAIEMLPYEVEYSSSNEKISVNEEGQVKVASDAIPGSSANIYAKLTDKDGKTYSDTCTITVIGTYSKESAAKQIASLYNEYFHLSEGDEGAATTEVTKSDTGWVIYSIKAATNFSTIKNLENFVDENLIPGGFMSSGDWDKRTYDKDYGDLNGVHYEAHAYSYVYDDEEDYITLTANFNVYTDPTSDKIMLWVRVA